MKETLEKLWSEYFWEKSSEVDTVEERNMIKQAAELNEKLNALLNDEQKDAVEKYVEALYDVNSVFVKKAFFKGCEFTVSFLFEAGNIKK